MGYQDLMYAVCLSLAPAQVHDRKQPTPMPALPEIQGRIS